MSIIYDLADEKAKVARLVVLLRLVGTPENEIEAAVRG